MADEPFKGLEASINKVLEKVTEQIEVSKSLFKKIDWVVSTITRSIESVATKLFMPCSKCQWAMRIGNTRSRTKSETFPPEVSTSNGVNTLLYHKNGRKYLKKSFPKKWKKIDSLGEIVSQCRGKYILPRICYKERERDIRFLMETYPSKSINRFLNYVARKSCLEKNKNLHSHFQKLKAFWRAHIGI